MPRGKISPACVTGCAWPSPRQAGRGGAARGARQGSVVVATLSRRKACWSTSTTSSRRTRQRPPRCRPGRHRRQRTSQCSGSWSIVRFMLPRTGFARCSDARRLRGISVGAAGVHAARRRNHRCIRRQRHAVWQRHDDGEGIGASAWPTERTAPGVPCHFVNAAVGAGTPSMARARFIAPAPRLAVRAGPAGGSIVPWRWPPSATPPPQARMALSGHELAGDAHATSAPGGIGPRTRPRPERSRQLSRRVEFRGAPSDASRQPHSRLLLPD